MAESKEQTGGAAVDPWLDRVYHAKDAAEVGAHYDRWAEAYERDLMAAGYRYPAIAAALVARHVPKDATLLDAACGTGLMGEALAAVGYRDLIGLDLSSGMLKVAEAKGCYGRLIETGLGATIEGVADGSLGGCLCLGVLTPGHAPPESLTGLARAIAPGGVLVCSISTPAWEEGGFRAALEALEADGTYERLEETPAFRVMPYSTTEGQLTAKLYACRRN